jgi:hypothetical protein
MSVTATRIERNGPAIREALATASPEECHQFEVEFQHALVVAGETFDLGPVEAMLDRWWGIAAIRTNPLTEQEHSLVARARAGDDSGWAAPTRLPSR